MTLTHDDSTGTALRSADVSGDSLAGLVDMFKIGMGPSSSHTIGPMRAAQQFLQSLGGFLPRLARLHAIAYGSLAWTGKGHATDKALILGLAGCSFDEIDPDEADRIYQKILIDKAIVLSGGHKVPFDPACDLVFDRNETFSRHTNAMRFEAFDDKGGLLMADVWYSVGGGFVVREGGADGADGQVSLPYPFISSHMMLAMGVEQGLSIADMARANEQVRRPQAETDAFIDKIAATMLACIDRGLRMDGTLAGDIRLRRRAKELFAKTEEQTAKADPTFVMRRLSTYAIAVAEENAASGRIVTAPTNGAAGVIPAVLRYYLDYCPGANTEGVRTFFLVASTIGALIKRNASISGAEVGCQGEIGSASAMAAAGLAAALGATNLQIENAAEIALEHHLGLTCDPVGGLVQVPCIERNAFGAVKAVNAASLAMMSDGTHFVSLDQAIETMRQTGLDLHAKYKETALGGLAVTACGFHVPVHEDPRAEKTPRVFTGF